MDQLSLNVSLFFIQRLWKGSMLHIFAPQYNKHKTFILCVNITYIKPCVQSCNFFMSCKLRNMHAFKNTFNLIRENLPAALHLVCFALLSVKCPVIGVENMFSLIRNAIFACFNKSLSWFIVTHVSQDPYLSTLHRWTRWATEQVYIRKAMWCKHQDVLVYKCTMLKVFWNHNIELCKVFF